MSQLKMLALGLATAGALIVLPITAQTQTADRALTERLNDPSTSAAVKSRLLWNHSTSGLDIHVTTENGVVTLNGVIESARMRELAERLAADTNGVRQVRNKLLVQGQDLHVDSGQLAGGEPRVISVDTLNDAWITGKVKTLLLLTHGLTGRGIDVETHDGQVNLSGETDSAAAKQQAEKAVRTVRGVRDVDAVALKIDS